GHPHARAIRASSARVRPDDAVLLAAADLLNAGERVTILTGAGCRGAHDELVALAERLKAPVVHALRGKEWVEYDNPYDVGMNGRRRLIGSFNHGSMANALPQALGVQASQPGRQVVTLSGDGGLSMLLGELLTLRQQRRPIKVVVYNNGALGFVELEMKADG